MLGTADWPVEIVEARTEGCLFFAAQDCSERLGEGDKAGDPSPKGPRADARIEGTANGNSHS